MFLHINKNMKKLKINMFNRLFFTLRCVFVITLCMIPMLSCAPRTSLVSAKREIPLPAIMYHSILRDPTRAGTYVISPELLRDDLTYLKQNGYTTVFVSDLINFVSGCGALPEKPVLITLDDGYYNNLVYVLPILEELDMKAVISVVGSFTQTFSDCVDPNPNYGHCSWEEIRQLVQSGHVEIGNHSYNMHSQSARFGSMRRAGEGKNDYRNAFCDDIGRMQDALMSNSGVECVIFAYPFGQISPETRGYLKEMGFCCTLTCYEKVSTITQGDADCLFGIGRFNRPSGVSTIRFMRNVLGDID